jgi:hypothetical protein
MTLLKVDLSQRFCYKTVHGSFENDDFSLKLDDYLPNVNMPLEWGMEKRMGKRMGKSMFKQRQYVPLTATRKCPLDCVSI